MMMFVHTVILWPCYQALRVCRLQDEIMCEFLTASDERARPGIEASVSQAGLSGTMFDVSVTGWCGKAWEQS